MRTPAMRPAFLDQAPLDWFPPPAQALRDPNGLLAIGGDLSRRRLLAAYRLGIFPWYSQGQPVLWWSPDPRTVLFPDRFRLRRSLAKRLRNGGFEVTFNTDFAAVIDACAAPRDADGGTWITSAMRDAYLDLRRAGVGFSVEVRHQDVLVGGLYGVLLGSAFFGESMFSSRPDASKVALAHLVRSLGARGLQLIDCQMRSAHLESLGAQEVPRAEFQGLLERAVNTPLEEPAEEARE